MIGNSEAVYKTMIWIEIESWIQSFLSSKTHHAQLHGGRSTCSKVLSGVPQDRLGQISFYY